MSRAGPFRLFLQYTLDKAVEAAGGGLDFPVGGAFKLPCYLVDAEDLVPQEQQLHQAILLRRPAVLLAAGCGASPFRLYAQNSLS